MAGQSNHDRAYLMALGAWKSFGYTSESPSSLARRMAEIGGTQGLSAAAEAIAEDCRQHGLVMSASRVLKSLSDVLGRYGDRINRLNNIEEFTIEDMKQADAQQFNVADALSNTGASNKHHPLLATFWVITAIVVFWLIVRACQ
jgi:hypothetical protein